ncbi:SDR family NAD(P)-dependent oxidoreductase [Streptomyces diastaticus]|uniref:SDR family NAD(P)-dependent oxidoreductase n=1 Tax=Streptomyces diastaticus TaxID=1956 RepID=UPI0034096C07
MTDEAIECVVVLSDGDFIMRNHHVHGVSVMPGVTFLDIICRVIEDRGLDHREAVLERILFREAVATAPGVGREIRVTVSAPAADGTRAVRAESRRLGTPGSPWRENLQASLRLDGGPESGPLDVPALRAAAVRSYDMADLYARARAEDIRHGTAMACHGTVHVGDGHLLAELRVDSSAAGLDGFLLHPALLDASTIAAYGQTEAASREPFIPVYIDRFRALRPLGRSVLLHVPAQERLAASGDVISSDYSLHDHQGRLLAEFTGLTCKRIRRPELITRLLAEDEAPDPATGTGSTPARPAAERDSAVPEPPREAVAAFTARLRRLVGRALGADPAQVRTDTGFYELGLDSAAMVRISRQLEESVGDALYPTLLFEFTDIDGLAAHLGAAHAYREAADEDTHGGDGSPQQAESPGTTGLFRPEWAPAPDGEGDMPEGDIVLCATGGDPAALEDVARELRSRLGDRCRVVEAGPAGDEDGGQRWDELTARGVRPVACVLFGAEPDEGEPVRPAAAVLRLAGAMAGTRPGRRRTLLFVHRTVDGRAAAENLAVGALARSLTGEAPDLDCRAVGVGTWTASRTADVLARELRAPGGTPEIRYAGGTRQARVFRPEGQEPVETARRPALIERGVYVISGGSGRLAAVLAGHLAGAHRARIALLARGPASGELRERITHWRALGAEVEYLRADVTRREEVEDALVRVRARYGRIDGVFHTAGVMADSLFRNKTPEILAEVVAPKALGAVHLDAATAGDDLDLFVLYSSLSASQATLGQSDYAFANAFLDHFAEERASRPDRPGRTHAIAWPMWAEGGMRLSPEAVRHSREVLGTWPMPTDEGLGLLDRVLAGPEGAAVAVHGSAEGVARALPRPASAAGAAHEAAAEQVHDTDRSGSGPDRRVPVAVVGVAGSYPQAPDVEAFWRNLAEGRDCVTEIPADRWDHSVYFDTGPGAGPGTTYSRWGGFLDGVDRFDRTMFGISRRDAERMDPQERLFLTTCWKTLQNAGHPPQALTDETVGVFAGVMWNHYQLFEEQGVAPTAMHAAVANRVSYCFDLTGPSMAVDTACSSSLTAVHLAVESIRRGECTMALAGGVNVTIHPQKYLQLAQGRFLAEDGRCRSFGKGATGYVPGEGVGAVLLKPLHRAEADGDHILGVIRATSANHTGRTSGFTVPSPHSQAALIQDAWRRAGIAPDTVGCVEAHGTGTALGDPVEAEGLRKALEGAGTAPGSCAVGSVKSSIGHLESAAGIAGLTKVLLQLRHGTLVPSLHAEELNPHLDLDGTPFRIQRERAPWPAPFDGSPRRAGVSAFGAGGANVHLVVEEYPTAPPRPRDQGDRARLFVLSARDDALLREYAERLRDHLEAAAPAGTAAPVEPGESALTALTAELLGIAPAQTDPDVPLGDLGLDASSLRELARRAEERLGAAPPPGAWAPQATLRGLAARTGPDAGPGIPLDALLHTLQVGRTAMPHRMAIVLDPGPAALGRLRAGLDRFLAGGAPDDRHHWPAAHRAGRAEVSREECAELHRRGRVRELAAAWVAGADVPWAELSRAGTGRPPGRTPLPHPPLREESCWIGNWRRGTGTVGAPTPAVPSPAPRGNAGEADGDGSATRPTAAGTASPVSRAFDDGPAVELRVLDPGIALVVMRSGGGNMFTEETVRGLESAFERLGADETVKVVVLTGGQAFSMGGTPEALERLAEGHGSFTDVPFLYEGLLRCDRPVIAALSGHASGGGLAFGLHADIVLMAREGMYAANFLNYGFTPGMGATYILERRLGRSTAAEMFYSAKPFSGAELERRGAQVTFLARDEVLPAALDLARSVAGRPPAAVRALKRELASRTLDELSGAVEKEAELHTRVLGQEAVTRVRDHTGRVRGYADGDAPVAAAPPRDASSPAPQERRAAPPSEPAGPDRETVIAAVVDILCGHLYLTAEEIDRRLSFSEMGVDSLGAVEIVRDLDERFGVGLDSVAVYDHPTLDRLADFVLAEADRGRALRTAALSPREPAVRTATRAPAVHLPEAREQAPKPPLGPGPARPPEPTAAPESPPAAAPAPVVLAPVPAGAAARPAPLRTVPPSEAGDRDPAARGPADIAVIGMSGRFPDAPDLDAFWENLAEGRCSIREVPAERWDTARHYDPDRRARGSTYSKWAALLPDVDRFDAAFFRLSPMEAELIDPQQRLFLEEAWSALEDAGYAAPGGEPARCGVFVGSGAGDYLSLLERAGRDGAGQAFLGNSSSILAARIAYHLDLKGPSVSIDTACSSSLVAIHQAVSSLRSGECDMALAGGVALMITPRMHVWTSATGVLSPTGRCAPFDASADGIVLGEAVGAVVLKPLERALADGDTVHAVIKGTGVNGDGRTNGLTAPSADAQAALLDEVYTRSGLSPDEVGYVEAHGTGTPLGDPIEAKALVRVFGRRDPGAGPCHVGSVKANIGHTTIGAGMAGFLKTVLALRRGVVPPTPGFGRINPKISFAGGPLRVATETVPWQPGPSGARVGAVSSFGFSGTNAHVVLAEAPAAPPARRATEDGNAVVLPLSAMTDEGLHRLVGRMADALSEEHDLGDVARTLALSRTHFPVRTVLVAATVREAREQAAVVLAGGTPALDRHGAQLRRFAEDYLAGREVRWSRLHAGRPRRNVPLPTYPFAVTGHWAVTATDGPEEEGAAPEPPGESTGAHRLMVCRPSWREAPGPRAPQTAPGTGRRVVLVHDADAGRLADALAALHQRDDVVRVPLSGAGHPHRGGGQRTPDIVYLLAGSGPREGEEPSGDPAALGAFRALGRMAADGRARRHPLTVKFAVHGTLRVLEDDEVRLHGSGLTGLSRAVAAEHPAWSVHCVDVGCGEGEDLAGEAAARIAAESDGSVVAWRGGRRYERSFQPVPEPVGEADPFRTGGAYLIVGGTGGLGLAVGRRLASEYQARLVWLGRRPADAAEVAAGIAEIEELGGRARYVRGDVADPAAVRAAVAEARRSFGALHGVVHAAGVLRDKSLARMTEEEFTEVLEPKTAGAGALLSALEAEGERPDFCVLFSSAASFVAAAGQANYAAAATIEDAYAWRGRSRTGFPVAVLNWGYWGGVGAVADERYRRSFLALGVGSVDPGEGFTALRHALRAGEGQTLVIKADPARMAEHGMPLAERSGEEASERTRSYLRRVFAQVLKCEEQDFRDRQTFENFGVDSLSGAEIVDLLSRDLGELPATLLFEHPTIERLADHLLALRGDRLPPHGGGDEAGGAEEAAEGQGPSGPGGDAGHAVDQEGEAGARPSATTPAAGSLAVADRAEEAIAVVGVAGRYPQAPDLDAFWRNLAEGRNCVTEVPPERWDWREHFSPRRGQPHTAYGRWAGFLEDVDRFDPGLFGVLPREAAAIDPQERLFLETCWNLLEETGYLGEHHRVPETGVFAGLMYGSYGKIAAAEGWPRGEFGGAHSAYWSVANRVSYFFDLNGPSLAVDSACSSSLTAVHLACDSIRRGECRMAIAGGVNLVLHPAHLVALSGMNMLAGGDGCRPFDAEADGYVPGEGVGAVLLKPLADAVADGDTVWGVIKASRANAGGKTSGYTVPSPQAQSTLIGETLRRAGTDPRTIGYVEAHGTGTALGDPIEIAALTRAFDGPGHQGERDGHRCAVGSVKSNIGHLEGAAGIAGLTKVLLQLRHGRIAPNANLERVNPKIGFEATPFVPQTTLAEWPRPVLEEDGRPREYPRRAGVSSFGAGGANVHLVVEEYRAEHGTSEEAEGRDQGPLVFLLSARDGERLRELARRVATYVAGAPRDGLRLRDLAWTSQTGRREMNERLAVMADGLDTLAVTLRLFAEGEPSPLVRTGTVAGGASRRWRGQAPAAAAEAWVTGAEVDWAALWSGPRPRRVPFPTYPFARSRHWLRVVGTGSRPDADTEDRPRTGSRPDAGGERRDVAAGARTVPTEEAGRCRFGHPEWQTSPLDGTEQAPAGTVLVVGPDSRVAEELAEQLASGGSVPVPVVPGAAFGPYGAGYRMDAADPGQCQRLVAELTRRGPLPDTVVCTASEGPAWHDASEVPGHVERGFHTLFGVVTALLAAAPGTRELRVVFGYTAPTPASRPYDAAVGAALRTLSLERSGFGGAAVAFEGGDALTDPALRAARLLAEVRGCRPGRAEDVRYRAGERQVKVLADFTPEEPAAVPLRAGGTYLVTGGAGALGLHVARHLTEQAAVNVVLVGRSPLDAERARLVDGLSGAGGSVRYLRADVSSGEEVRRLVTEVTGEYGPVHGVVHAAGVTRDSLATTKTRADIEAVLAPKVSGAVALDEATLGQPLDFFVLFSSVVAHSGNPGQFDYAYANAFLDEFARQREQRRTAGLRSGRTVSIGWPLWAEGGVTVDEATEKILVRRWGMEPMSTANGLRALEVALTCRKPCLTVVQTVRDPDEASGGGGGRGRTDAEDRTGGEEPPPASPDAPPADVERLLRTAAADFLMVGPDDVDMDAQLLELGFDSITLTELIVLVNETYGLDLLPTVLFECADLASFTTYLQEHHADELSRAGARTGAEAAPEPARPPARQDGTAGAAGPGGTAEPAGPAEQPAPGGSPYSAGAAGPEATDRPPGPLSSGVRPGAARYEVAVIGMAGVLPGSPDTATFWEHLAAGRDLVTEVPADRTDLLRHPGAADLRGGFLDAVDRFDAGLFGIAPREAALMDPQQRLFLETSWHAVWDAGYRPAELAGTATGLFAGTSTSDYADLLARNEVPVEAHSASGVAHAVLANRVSYLMDLRGPSEAVDTACSSSLVAVHRAVQALASGECDQALVGGVGALLSPALFTAFHRSGMLSADGRCKTFDAAADGYVRGEGCGVVLLKPLHRALADGDHVHGVVTGTAVGHGGRSSSLTAPSPEAQAHVVTRAHRRAGTDPDALGYVEAHGTGTGLGDPVEIEGLKRALTALYADRGQELPDTAHIAVGSVKTNIGHLEAAAGMAGMLKVLLSMEHGTLPPSLHLDRLNPHIRLAGTPLRINTGTVPWDVPPGAAGGAARIAGVSSFGFGGTNAHVVLESAPPRPSAPRDGGPRLVVLSAPSTARLARYAERLARHLEDRGPTLDEVARTLQTGRQEWPERLAVVVRDVPELVRALGAVAREEHPPGVHRGTARSDAPPATHHGDLDALARAWCDGAAVAWERLWTGPLPRRVPLPAFPLADTRHWFPSAPSRPSQEAVIEPLRRATEPQAAPRRSKVRLAALDRAAAPPAGPGHTLAPLPAPEAAPATAARPPAAREVAATITGRLAEILGAPASGIGVDTPFAELGLDSIFRMDLVRLLNEVHGLDLKAAELYEHDTVERLTRIVVDQLADDAPPPPSPPSPPPVPVTVSGPSLPEERRERTTPVAPAGGQDGERFVPALTAVLAEAVGREVDPARPFTDQGFTSFEMLKSVVALEQRLGAQRKTLLYDHPTVRRLAEHLREAHGTRAAAALAREPEHVPSPPGTDLAAEPPAGRPEDGPAVLRKSDLVSDASTAALIEDIDSRHAKEGGLPGRDIAPLIFLGSRRTAYFNFSQRGGSLLAWSYVGSREELPRLVAEWTEHAERRGLRPNLLSMVRLERVGDRPFSATPFGVVQRLEDLPGFTLQGSRMQRVRHLVHKFERMVGARTEEYEVGSDPATDLRIVGLIDGWCATKDMVNPYVSTVRDEIGRGVLGERHRMFLTYAGGELHNAVIVTRIPSEDGYLLDLEFYSGAAPRGSLEYTIVRIIGLLVAEGRTLFSFGASLGVRFGDSENADPATERALAELRSREVFTGEGNFRFKNKFRPVNLPIYLCRPADADPTDVSEVILMIADPEVGEARGTAGTPDAAACEAAVPRPSRTPTRSGPGPLTGAAGDRERLLADHGFNPLRLEPGAVEIDLVTDSWAEIDAPYVTEAMDALRDRAAGHGRTAVDLEKGAGLPFAHAVATMRGRSAEALLCRAWPGPRGLVVQNALFPTWAMSQLDHGFTPLTVPPAAADADHLFRADPDTGVLDRTLAENAGRVSFVCLETSTNATGGYPVSLAGLRRVKEITTAHGVPLVLDATRLLENAAFVAAHEEGRRRPLWDVADEILRLADTVTMSLSKDFGVDCGGLVATDDHVLGDRLREDVMLRGAEPGAAHRRLIAAALADRERAAEGVTARMAAVRALWKRLEEAGLPVLGPAAGHCVLLDTAGLGAAGDPRHRTAGWLSWLYLHTGVRAAPHLVPAPDGAPGDVVRLAVPVGLGVEAAEEAGRRIVAAVRERGPAPELAPVGTRAHPARAEYRPADTLPEDVLAAMHEGHTPLSDNHAVLKEHQPAVVRHLVALSEGQAEAFVAGEGTPLVLLHPFNIGAGFFAPQFAALADRHRVISVHHAGVGATTVAADLSVEGMADVLGRTLDALDVRGPVHLAGASFGALPALEFALRHPRLTASVTLIGGSYKVGNRRGEMNRLELVAGEDFDRLLAQPGTEEAAERRAHFEQLLLRCESLDGRIGLRYLDEFDAAPNLLPRLGGLGVPALIVHGRHDTVVPLKTGHLLHGTLPDVRYEEFENAGHFPSLTSAERFNRLLAGFLEERDRAVRKEGR